MKRKMLLIPLVLLLIASLVAVGCAAPAPPAPAPAPAPAPPVTPVPVPVPVPPAPTLYRFNVASTTITSSVYAQNVAMTDALALSPLLEPTLVVGGGADPSNTMLQKGIVSITLCGTIDTLYDAYNGVGVWKDKPEGAFKDLRLLMVKAFNATHLAVRADSGIEKPEDLQGKKFCLGDPGHASTPVVRNMLKALGITVDEFVGSYGDAIEAIKDRRIIGVAKQGMGFQVDAKIIELTALTPIRILSFTEEQQAIIKPDYPMVAFGTIPAGTITALPDQPTITTRVDGSGTSTSAKVPQEIIYEVLKTWEAHWEDVVIPAFSPSAEVYPESEVTVSYYAGLEGVGIPPLHAGAVQYYKEKGYEIPDWLIPPEYKP